MRSLLPPRPGALRPLIRLISATAALVLPTSLARTVLNALGHRIAPGARIGFSVVLCDRIQMRPGARIGHLNIVRIRRMALGERARIGHLNRIEGPLSIVAASRGIIGNRNQVSRGGRGVSTGSAQIRLGELGAINSDHFVDCTKSIRVGNFSTIAGKGSQLWTHGYVHDLAGEGRYRIDGPIDIGNNVYIGARSVVTMGVSIVDGAIVGSGTTVARSLTTPDLYVAGPLRAMPRPARPETRDDLTRATDADLTETVYLKKR